MIGCISLTYCTLLEFSLSKDERADIYIVRVTFARWAARARHVYIKASICLISSRLTLLNTSSSLFIMKITSLSILALAAHQVSGHATFQALWVNGVDLISFTIFLQDFD